MKTPMLKKSATLAVTSMGLLVALLLQSGPGGLRSWAPHRELPGEATGAQTLGLFPAVLSLPGCGTPQDTAAQPVTPAGPATGGASACTKDTDCKGDRICTRGACVDPNAAK